MGISFTGWNSIFLYPLRILVVFFHEASHAIAAIISGGRVVEIVISTQEGGYALTAGGNGPLISCAGYLGSLACGIIIFLSADRSSKDKEIMMTLGIIIIGISLLYVRNLFTFGFCLLTGSLMMYLGNKATEITNDICLRVIGLTSMMYVPLDIYSDTIQRSHLRSDARILAEQIGGSSTVYGIIWLLLALFVIFFSLKSSLQNEWQSNNTR